MNTNILLWAYERKYFYFDELCNVWGNDEAEKFLTHCWTTIHEGIRKLTLGLDARDTAQKLITDTTNMKSTQAIVTTNLLSSIKASMEALESRINNLQNSLSKESDEVKRICNAAIEKDYGHLAVLKDWYDRTISSISQE